MKKIISYSVALFLIVGLVGLSSCTKAPLVIKYNLGDLNLPIAASSVQAYQVFTFNINHSDVQAFLNANGGTANITSAIVNGITAKVTTTGSDFSQIGSIEADLKPATNTTSDGDQVAYCNVFSTGMTQTALKVNGTDEKQLLSQDMVLTVKVLPSSGAGNAALNVTLTQGYIEIKVKQ